MKSHENWKENVINQIFVTYLMELVSSMLQMGFFARSNSGINSAGTSAAASAACNMRQMNSGLPDVQNMVGISDALCDH